jgi:hypothetical protein
MPTQRAANHRTESRKRMWYLLVMTQRFGDRLTPCGPSPLQHLQRHGLVLPRQRVVSSRQGATGRAAQPHRRSLVSFQFSLTPVMVLWQRLLALQLRCRPGPDATVSRLCRPSRNIETAGRRAKLPATGYDFMLNDADSVGQRSICSWNDLGSHQL